MTMRFRSNDNSTRAGNTFSGRTLGTVEIYTGAPPAQVTDNITSQVLLVTFQLGNPVGDISSGIFTARPIADATAVASGVAQWYRQLSSQGAVQRDGVIGLNSADDMQIADANISNGQVIAFVQWIETESNMYNANPAT